MMAFHGQLTYLLNIAGHNIDCFHEFFHHFKFNTNKTHQKGEVEGEYKLSGLAQNIAINK